MVISRTHSPSIFCLYDAYLVLIMDGWYNVSLLSAFQGNGEKKKQLKNIQEMH